MILTKFSRGMSDIKDRHSRLKINIFPNCWPLRWFSLFKSFKLNLYMYFRVKIDWYDIFDFFHVRFILRFSHFDVNLLRHRHFRFTIVSVNRTNWLCKKDFTSMQVGDLMIFLQQRGVSCCCHWKYHLKDC